MNEHDLSSRIRRALDESVEQLPYRVTHRLAASREAALGRMRAAPQRSPALEMAAASATPLGPVAMPGVPALPWRLAGVLIPLLIVLAGMISIALWDDAENAQELADVDEHVLTDDVPISAYTDRGFGVFLSNTRQQP